MRKTTVAVALIAVVASALVRGEEFVLASAQVVDSTTAPPVLKLTANGPIAFEVVQNDQADGTDGGLVVRLYGVHPSGDLSLGSLAPFSVSVTEVADGCRLRISMAQLAGSPHWVVKTGGRANELEVSVAE